MKDSFAFFGTPYVARDTLALLALRGFTPEVVITNPDAPRGRGYKLTASETKQWAVEHNLPVFTPSRLDKEAIEHIRAYGCAYAIVVAYGMIFPESLISIFPKGVLNIHYSLLPRYRGAAPVEAALLSGDSVTGVTVQMMAPALDAGDIIAQKKVAIDPHETTKDLRPRLITVGAELLAEILPPFLRDEITPVPQGHADATYAGKLKKEDSLVDLSAPDRENWNKYRAHAEWPGTYFFHPERGRRVVEKGGKKMRVKITDATLEKDGSFKILKVIPEGRKETAYDTFLNHTD